MISEHSDIWKLTLIKRNLGEVRVLYPQSMIMIMQLFQTEFGLSPSSVGNVNYWSFGLSVSTS